MSDYSYHKSERHKKVNRIVRAITKFHLTHQNVVLLVLGFIFAYLLIKNQILIALIQSLTKFGYLSVFILGFLFSFGTLTAPSAAALYILAKSFNPIALALVASIGAMISNYLIFKFVKEELMDELRYVLSNDLRLDVPKLEQKVHKMMFRSKFLQSLIPGIAGILVSLPLPTEMIVSILWTVARYDSRKVLFYSFLFSFVGILNIALFSHAFS